MEEVEGDKRRQIDCDSTPARVSAYLPLQDRKKSSNTVDPLLHAFYPYSHLLCLLHTEHSQNGLQGRWYVERTFAAYLDADDQRSDISLAAFGRKELEMAEVNATQHRLYVVRN